MEKNRLDLILDKTRIMLIKKIDIIHNDLHFFNFFFRDKLIEDNHYLTNELEIYRKIDNQKSSLKKEINVKNCLTKIS